MTREEAIKILMGYSHTPQERAAMEVLIPELTESEDEQAMRIIRKRMCYDPVPISDEDRRIVEAWLEKQKEHQNNSDAPEKALGQDLTFPQDKDKNLDDIAQEYVEGVKEYNPTPDWNLIHTAVCYGYHLADQKEQKPADWSKNDTVFLNEIIDFFENKTVRLQHDIDMYAHWLKSLPERFNLQPKQDWSEEDRHAIENCEYAIKETFKDEQNPHRIGTLDWLKSLRPSWKPSEEQMLKKSMPTWKRSHNNYEVPCIGSAFEKTGRRYTALYMGGYLIDLDDLFNKLPKEQDI